MVRMGHIQRSARLNVCVLLAIGGSLFVWLGGNCGGVPLAPLDPNAGVTDGNGRPVLGAAAANEAPSLVFKQPSRDLVIDRGLQVLIEWDDADPDNNAVIQLVLDRDGIPSNGNEVPLISDRLEDPDGFQNDRYILETGSLQTGNYIVRASISDGINAIVQVQAPGILSIVPPGTGPRNAPPVLNVLTPALDTGVAQDDTVIISWTDEDPDDNAEVLVLLDKDSNPNNDDPNSPSESGVIVLPDTLENPNPRPEDNDLPPDPTNPLSPDDRYVLTIDVSQIPIREDGSPYFIRVMISDGINPPVNRYAAGVIRVLGMASGTVDLARVGKQIMGARWQGFKPGSLTGTRVRYVMDTNGDGADDCCIIARFGNPGNVGNIGKAWMLFGRPGERFGGDISINSIATRVPGHQFAGPRTQFNNPPNEQPRTEGITDVVPFPNIDLNDATGPDGSGLPELVFGLPHVDGLADARDDDPADTGPGFGAVYCDPWGNNLSDDSSDGVVESMGMVSLVSSVIWTDPAREDGTIFPLEVAGQGARDGARWQACIFDPFQLNLVTGGFGRCATGSAGFPAIGTPGSATVNAHWGQSVDVLPDIDNDQIPELIISAPRNMLDVEFWRSQYPALLPGIDSIPRPHPHLPVVGDISGEFPGIDTFLGGSRFYEGNVIVFFGQDWINQLSHSTHAGSNSGDSSTAGDQNGVMSFPYIDPGVADPWDPFCCFAEADATPPCDDACFVRGLVTPSYFEIAGEKPSDELGGGRSAGDFNLDGSPDIVMGAPFADQGDRLDTGAAYIVFGQLLDRAAGITIDADFGNIRLSDLNNPALPRPPTIRIFGDHVADRLGSWQEGVRDLNGDRIDDVVIASGDVDGPNGIDSGMVGVIFGGQQVTGDFIASELATPELRGIRFYGAHAGDRAGVHASSAGDYNGDGFGDLLITAPGEIRVANGLLRRGIVYLIFGGPHLDANRVISLDLVGRPPEDANGNGVLDTGEDSNQNGLLDPFVPGIVFISPYQFGSLDEAAPMDASFVGDLDSDGFDDIMIGNPEADFIDPKAPTQRRADAGEVYLIYGSNAGTNSLAPQGIVSGP